MMRRRQVRDGDCPDGAEGLLDELVRVWHATARPIG
jgi:hypothetical protein